MTNTYTLFRRIRTCAGAALGVRPSLAGAGSAAMRDLVCGVHERVGPAVLRHGARACEGPLLRLRPPWQ